MSITEHAYWILGCIVTLSIPAVLLGSVVFGGLYRDHEERSKR